VSPRTRRMEPAGNPFAEATDAELFDAMADGDLGPLGELFDRYHANVRAFAERLLGHPADAADMVQETFLTAARASTSFQPGASAKPFLLGVAAQLARRRRRSFVRLRALLTAFEHAPTARRPTPEDHLAAGEDAALLDEALAKLSHEHREVLLLVDLGGLSGVEAAKALGVPSGTVWRRLHEARAQLRDRIQRGRR
jgi:RNA polymerase sigma factor (sigma-70 family)